MGKINPKRLGGKKWTEQKQKAAAFLKLSEQLGGKHIIHQTMKRNWYRHIDKAIAGKSTTYDERHWKKMFKEFSREIVGVPSTETTELLDWLRGMPIRVRDQEIGVDDLRNMLPRFRKYMESCEANALDNYIIKNKLMEAEE